jgi:hypothetical protein
MKKLYMQIDFHSNNKYPAITNEQDNADFFPSLTLGFHKCFILIHKAKFDTFSIRRACKTGGGSSEIAEDSTSSSHNSVHEISFFANSFLFAAMWAKNVLLPTPAISKTSTAVLSEFSYKILACSNFAGSVLGLPPVFFALQTHGLHNLGQQ